MQKLTRADKIKYKHYIQSSKDGFSLQTRQLEVENLLKDKGIKFTRLMFYLEGKE